MKKIKLFRRFSFRRLAWGVCCLAACPAHAQELYSFCCRDYVSTDNNRAPQSAFSYNDAENTFTVSAVGDCNIAFKMDANKDGAYYIRNTQDFFLVEGTGLSLADNQSYIWWFNGFNNNGQTAPTCTLQESGKGTSVALWDIRNIPALHTNMNYNNEIVLLSSHGQPFIHAMGLTAAGSGATISNIAYCARYEAAARYPRLLDRIGYTSQTLTAEVKEKLGQAIKAATALVEGEPVSAEKEKVQAALRVAQGVYHTGDAADYAGAFGALEALEGAMADYKSQVKSFAYEKTGNGIRARLNDMYVHIVFHADGVLRVCKSPQEPLRGGSLSVISTPMERVEFDLTEEAERQCVTLSAHQIRVVYHLATGQVETFRTDGSVLLREKENGTSFLPVKDGPNDSYLMAQSFVLKEDEDIFGMGQIQDGKLSRRGTTFSLQQDNRKVCIPYFQSTGNYALFWDNYSPTVFTDNEKGTRFQSTGTAIDYYILYGGQSADVLAAMRGLTGKSPMPALWNFGLYQSKERYTSADETMGVLRKYRELGVPLDCIVQDWQYWGDNAHWNALEFLNPTFSNHEELIRTVHENRAKLMISIWANFGPDTKPYASMNEKGRLIPAESYPPKCGVRPYDVYGPTARDIYWDYLYKGLITKGIDAYWMDSSEPDYFDPKPTDMDYVTETGQTWRALRNAFPLAHVGGVYTHHREAEAHGDSYLKNKRVSILTRSAFAGQQRYGANTWSGDVTASWENFAAQIPAACNLSACGIPYWNSDIGGFFLGSFKGVGDPAWRRLYMRWVQFGAFTPMMRFHGTQTPREIYQFGSAGDGVGDFDQILKYVKMRYRLLPYLYSTAWQVSAHDATFMQALALAFNEDTKGYGVTDEYMFGDAFLVAPVVQDGVNRRDVYLPAGHKWIDFWTGQSFEGGQTVRKEAHADVLPLYVKAGSILPWGPDVQYATEKPWDNLEIRVYPGADGRFVLYEDENDGYNYEQGQYTEIPFEWDEATQTLTIGDRKGAFEGMLKKRTFRICKVTGGRGTGDEYADEYTATVTYKGKSLRIKLKDGGR